MARLIENNGNGKTAVLDVIISQTVAIDKSSRSLAHLSVSVLRKRWITSVIIIGLGFPADGDGIIAGAVWANAWGSYWSWDPKGNLGVDHLLVFAAYLHAHVSPWLAGTSPCDFSSG